MPKLHLKKKEAAHPLKDVVKKAKPKTSKAEKEELINNYRTPKYDITLSASTREKWRD